MRIICTIIDIPEFLIVKEISATDVTVEDIDGNVGVHPIENLESIEVENSQYPRLG